MDGGGDCNRGDGATLLLLRLLLRMPGSHLQGGDGSVEAGSSRGYGAGGPRKPIERRREPMEDITGQSVIN